MIDPKNYNHKLYEIAKEGKSGDWKLIKDIEPKFTIVVVYDVTEGYIYKDVLSDDFSYVGLTSDSEYYLGTMDSRPWHHIMYQPAVDAAHGRVLSCGQGAGLFPVMVLDKLQSGQITQLDILEINGDILKLTWGYTSQLSPKIRLIEEDAFEFLVKENTDKYDLVFWDIGDNLACVIAQGLRMKDRCRVLTPTGKFMYWGQEIGEKLTPGKRGLPDFTSDLPCRCCGTEVHSNLHGGLCMECADEFEREYFKETPINAQLTEILQSLGYKVLKPKVSDMDIADLVVETLDKKYLVECKTSLTDSDMYRKLMTKVVSYSQLRDQYDGLKLVMHGETKLELVSKLGQFIESQGLSSWVEILGKGDTLV